jgi:hypothetical protein
MPWYQSRTARHALRLLGVALLALAWLAARTLRTRAIAGPISGDALAWLLAMASFVLATGGAALALLGNHLFDQIQVARQWSRYGP